MDTWDDKTTGEKRSKIKVLADRVQFLDRRDASASPDDESGAPRAREAPPRRASSPGGPSPAENGPPPARGGYPAPGAAPRRPAPESEPAEGDEEDIPF